MEQAYKKILVGIDGSEQAFAAFKKAVEVARRNEAHSVRDECDRPTILSIYGVYAY